MIENRPHRVMFTIPDREKEVKVFSCAFSNKRFENSRIHYLLVVNGSYRREQSPGCVNILQNLLPERVCTSLERRGE